MNLIKRLLTVRVLAVVGMILLVVGSYAIVNRVLASEIELGMDRDAVIAILGMPNLPGQPSRVLAMSEVPKRYLIWDRMLFSRSIFHQQIFITLDAAGKVEYFQNTQVILGCEVISN